MSIIVEREGNEVDARDGIASGAATAATGDTTIPQRLANLEGRGVRAGCRKGPVCFDDTAQLTLVRNITQNELTAVAVRI